LAYWLKVSFNESGNFKTVQQEAMLIIGLVIAAGVLVSLVLPTPGNLLAIVAQAVVLYLGVKKICDLTKPAAIRVTIWYFAITFMIGLGIIALGEMLASASGN
jgi:hypothetical protein